MAPNNEDKQQFEQVRIGRRRLLIRVGSTAAVFPFLQACSTATPATPATSAAPAPAAVRAGALRYAINIEPDSLDPHFASLTAAYMATISVIETLVIKNPADGKYQGYLAESWTMSQDGLSYTFKLRKDVKFHDGTVFNAAAVKYNLDRIVDPGTKSKYAITALGPYESTTVVDEFTAVVKLKKTFPALIDSLSYTPLGMLSPTAVKNNPTTVGVKPIGTGFMQIEKYTPKDSIVLVRNANYSWPSALWAHKGAAYLEKVTFVIVPENAARVTALESGDVQAAEDIPGQDVARLKANAKFTFVEGLASGAPRGFFMNIERAPLNDINVRKAIIHGLNRIDVIQLALFGLQQPAEGPFVKTLAGYTKKVEGLYPFDAAKAGKLLDDAGWRMGANGIRAKDGQPLKLLGISNAVFEPIFVASQSLLRKIGVDIEVRTLDATAWLASVSKGDHHLAMTGFVGTDPSGLSLLYHSRNYNGLALSRYKDAGFDKLWDDAGSEPDETKRTLLYEKIQLQIMENALVHPIQQIKRLNFVASNVKGMTQDARGFFSFLYDTYVEPK